MNKVIDVATGVVKIACKKSTLKTSPLGSCVAVIAYDKTTKIGGIAHIMLPGFAPAKCEEANKYAENAIKNLLLLLNSEGVDKANIKISLVGGANVLRKKENDIAKHLIKNTFEIMKKYDLTVDKTHLGGYERRNASLHLDTGRVYFTVGDSIEYELISKEGL